jgi:hypothetical protein
VATVAEPSDDFFVGYGPALPPRTALVVRRTIALLLALAIVLPLVFVLARTPLAPARFEYGMTRRFRGTLHASPVPILVTSADVLDAARGGEHDDDRTQRNDHDGELAHGGDHDGALSTSTLLLVAPGKHGATPLIAGYDGTEVELAGTLVERGIHTMIEIEPGSIVPVVARSATTTPTTPSDVEDLGEVHLRGEIVDSKCHLGVMNPGDGKTHRGCAARCISGGIPPALRVRDAAGDEALYLLVGAQGEPIGRDLLSLVAEPVEIAGRVERRGDLLVLYAAPSAVRRLSEED